MARTARSALAAAGVALASLVGIADPASAASRPPIIETPDGFQLEGIDIAGRTAYVGSIGTGDVYAADLLTGAGRLLVDAPDGRAAIGVEVVGDLVVVAGGPTGRAFAYDRADGTPVAEWQLATPGSATFINDLVVARGAIWFTDSRQDVLHVLPLGADGVPSQDDVPYDLPLSGDLQLQPGFNLNGIEAAGRWLVAVQSATSTLFRIDPSTGATTAVAGVQVPNGDGLLLVGKRLHVVQNQRNQIAVVELAPDLTSGRVVEVLRDPDFEVPTTIARRGGDLYAVNARFGAPAGTVDRDLVLVDGLDGDDPDDPAS